MSETIGTAQIEVTGDARGFDATVKQAKKSLADLGAAASKSGKDTAQGMGQAGAATEKLDAATKRAAASIERQALALGKSKSEYYAAKAAIDGNTAALAPYIAKLREAEANVSATAKAQKSLSESSTLTARAFGAIAAGLSVAKLVQMADAVTVLQNQLKLATGSTASAAVAYEALFDIAQRSRVSFTELGSVYASVARAGATLGVSQNRLLKVTESIGNALTISGGSAASMQAALVQLSQGLASGTLRGEELNSVMEQTPRLAKALADGLGVSIGELREMGKAGQLTAETVIQALESQSAALANEVRNATLSVGQAFTVLQNSATKFVGDADKATGASAALAGALVSVSKGIDSVGKALSENSTIITTVLGGVAGAGAIAGLGAVAANIGKIRLAVLALGAALTANPLTLALLGIGAAVGGFVAYNNAASKTADGIRRTIAELESLNKTGPGIYSRDAEGMKSWEDGVARRSAQIRELRQQLALLDNQQLDTRAEDARFAASTRNVKANEGLAESMEAIRLRVAGVNKDYTQFYADLAVYQKARESGVVTEQEYVALVSQLSIEYAKGTKAVKSNKDAEKERWDDIKKRRQEQVDDTNSYLAGLQILAKEEADALAAVAKAYTASNEKQEAYTVTLREQTLRQLEQNEAIGLTAEELVKLEVAKLNDAAASKERLASDLAAAGESDRLVQAYRQQAAELRALAAAKADGGAKQAVADAAEVARESAKQAEADWKKAAAEIENDITDALMRGFESGKDFARNLRDTIVNMFKTLVLRPVIQATVQGGLNAIGLGAPAGAGGALNTVSNLNSLFNTGSKLASWLGLGAATGTGLVASAGTGMALASTGTGLGLTASMGTGLGLAGTGTGLGLTASAGTGTALTAGAATGGAGAMSSLAAAAPWLLGGLAVVSLLKGLDDSGTMHTGGAGSYSDAQGLRSGQSVDGLDFRPSEYKEAIATGSAAFAKGLVGVLDSTAKTFGKEAGYWAATGFADDTSKDGAWGALSIMRDGKSVLDWGNGADKWPGREFKDGEKGYTEYLNAVAGDVRDLLIESTPDWADAMLTGLGDSVTMDSLSMVVTQINQIQGALEGMGAAMPQLADLTGEATSALLAMFGNIENLSAASASYYQNFYTEAERADFATRQITAAMADLGVAMPASREGFRALVEAQDLNTEAGRKTYAALLQLAPAFASVTSVVTQSLAGLRSAADQFNLNAGNTTELALAQAQQAAALRELKTQLPGFDASGFSESDIQRYLTDARNSGEFQAILGEAGIQLAEAYLVAVNNVNRIRQSQTPSTGSTGGASANDYFSELQRLTDAALDGLRRAIDAERELAELSAQSARETVAAIQAVFGVIDTSLQSLYLASSTAVQQNAAQARALIAQAAGGGALPESSDLSAAIQSVQGGFDRTAYATAFDAERDRLRFAAELSRLRVTGGAQLSLAELQLKAAEDQLESLQAQFEAAQESVNVLRGIDTSVKSVSEAIAALAQAVLVEKAGAVTPPPGGSTGGSTGGGATTPPPPSSGGGGFVVGPGGGGGPVYETQADRLAGDIAAWEASGKDWTVSYLPGVGPVIVGGGSGTISDTQEKWLKDAGVPGFASGGSHMGGLRLVGENGPELEVTGPSRIYSAEQTRRLLQGSGDNAALLEEIRALRADNRAQASALVRMQAEMTKIMKRWDGNGMPEERVAA